MHWWHSWLERFQDPKWVGGTITAIALGAWRELRKRNDPTPRYERKAREIDALDERHTEVVVAEVEFSKDAEIERLRARETELLIANARLETRVAILEEAKLDLELRDTDRPPKMPPKLPRAPLRTAPPPPPPRPAKP